MSATAVRLPWSTASTIAQSVLQYLAPACERIQIAGSIRRMAINIGDVEILAIPKRPEIVQTDLFGLAIPPAADELTKRVDELLADGVFTLRPGVDGRTTYGPSNKLLIDTASGFAVDVFTTTAANWGMALVVRTGPGEFNVDLMKRFKQVGRAGHAYGGVTDRDGQEIACPDEETVFRLAELEWIKPTERRAI